MVKKQKVKGGMPAIEEGGGGSETQSVEAEDEGELGAKGDHRDMTNLNSDLLEQVISLLPQIELFEVMAVCRNWERTVMETSVLWQKVKVIQKWDTGGTSGPQKDGAGNLMIQRVLSFAQDVTILGGGGVAKEHVVPVAGVQRPH